MSFILILDAEGLYKTLELKILNFPDIKYRRNDNSSKYQLIERIFSEGWFTWAVYIAAFGRKMTKLGPHTIILVCFFVVHVFVFLFPLQEDR